jgi:hypothetical protein
MCQIRKVMSKQTVEINLSSKKKVLYLQLSLRPSCTFCNSKLVAKLLHVPLWKQEVIKGPHRSYDTHKKNYALHVAQLLLQEQAYTCRQKCKSIKKMHNLNISPARTYALQAIVSLASLCH